MMMFKRYHLVALFCLLSFMIVNPFTGSLGSVVHAQTNNTRTQQIPCLQAPANLDPTTLTPEQLREYGFPDYYSHTPKGKLEWLQTIARLKQDRHVCNASLSASDKAWFVPPSYRGSPGPFAGTCGNNPPPNGQGCNLKDISANWALGSQGQYFYTSTNYNLPCPKNTGTINNGQASWWIGLGSGLGDTGGGALVQAGNEIHIDSHGNVSFVGFFESTGLNYDDIDPFSMPGASCTNSMYVYLSDTSSDYFVMDGGGVNTTYDNPSWPLSDGMTDECAVERIFDKTHDYYLIFVDFNYIAFTNCEVNSQPIGQVTHYYTNMIDSNSNILAYPGPISSNGLNFNLYWKQVGCTC